MPVRSVYTTKAQERGTIDHIGKTAKTRTNQNVQSRDGRGWGASDISSSIGLSGEGVDMWSVTDEAGSATIVYESRKPWIITGYNYEEKRGRARVISPSSAIILRLAESVGGPGETSQTGQSERESTMRLTCAGRLWKYFATWLTWLR